MSLSSIRTWGWFPGKGGGSATIASTRTWGWLFDAEVAEGPTFLSLLYTMPVEHLGSISSLQKLPVELLGSLAILPDFNKIPIEIIGEEQFWILSGRGILWTIDDCGKTWIRSNEGSVWKLDERQ